MDADLHNLRNFVITYGRTNWSDFPEEALDQHIDELKTGVAQGIIALNSSLMIGMVTFAIGKFYLEYERDTSGQTGYIVEILVEPDYRGQHIGTHLVNQANARLLNRGVQTIYAKRHEENMASAAVFRKTGYHVIDVFPDPLRTTGTGRTALERYRKPV